MYYFIREKVIVFDTNLKKVTINNNNQNYIYFLFLQHCPIINLPVTPFVTQSHIMKEAFKPYSGFSDEIQTPCVSWT